MITPQLATQIRTSFGLDHTQMAVLVGTSQRQWYRYEDGSTPVPMTIERYLVLLMKYPEIREAELQRAKGS